MMFRLLVVACTLTTSVPAADASFEAAMALVRAKRYPEARESLEQVVAAAPSNAEAWHELGIVWRRRRDTAAYEQAVKCLGRAAELAPANARYLADYGGTSLELADRTRSLSLATRGREAMEKAVALDPDDLDAREGLYQFYSRAPFFVGGSASKAAGQLTAIRQQDPDRAVALEVLAKASDKQYGEAFRLCDEELAKHPDNYTALYQYGRTASVSGQNLPQGLACLKKALTVEPPHPASPTHSHVWYRIADIEQKLGHPTAARAAYESALQLDPGNRQAAAAIEKLK
jgi:tetratricopeptide (TPR) repeat protein